MANYTIRLGDAVSKNLIDWNKVMSTFPVNNDEEWRKQLSNMILKHYWFKEIGFETPQMFSFYMQMAMEEIMPYYCELKRVNELDLGIDPLNTFSEKETSSMKGNSQTNSTNGGTTTNTGNQKRVDDFTTTNTGSNKNSAKSGTVTDGNGTDNSINKNFDIATTGLDEGGLSDKYVTSATKSDSSATNHSQADTTTSGEGSSTSTNAQTGSQTTDSLNSVVSSNEANSSVKSSEDVIHSRTGTSTARFELMAKYREVLINLNMKIVKDKEVASCFMGVF